MRGVCVFGIVLRWLVEFCDVLNGTLFFDFGFDIGLSLVNLALYLLFHSLRHRNHFILLFDCNFYRLSSFLNYFFFFLELDYFFFRLGNLGDHFFRFRYYLHLFPSVFRHTALLFFGLTIGLGGLFG